MTGSEVKVTINGKAVSCPSGASLSALLRGHGFDSSPCGGHGRCGKCRVTAFGALSPLTEAEKRLLSPEEIAGGIRLACQVRTEGDCEISFAEGTKRDSRILTDGILSSFRCRPLFGPEETGAAVDVGTTTLAARLYDAKGVLLAEASRLNPQAVFGADVVSRMEAARDGHREELRDLVRDAVDGMLRELSPTPPRAVVVTGNTVMLHLFTMTDTEPLTHAPFEAPRLFGEILTAKELGLRTPPPEAPVLLPPAIASFVGADTATAMLACGFTEADGEKTVLLTDIGTNGEIVLRRNRRLYACSTAAGPAFEGAGISMGMGGAPGAVDHVSLSPEGLLQAHVIGDRAPAGICGSGLVDAVACLLENETLDETGYLEDDPAVILDPVSLTQSDIRAVQLAKSAIHSGIRTLLHPAETPIGEVSVFYVAGGFGSFLDAGNAGRIGLLPAELLPAVRVAGNAALAGAA
ncbi:MAG: DUF4445 domain-containing protein, partial [Clostridia bacterium]|nr:DUF4445 domain-containing protein [Clostridia bacterium]